jgi:hypothetical protein
MPPARASQPGTHLRCGGEQVPLQPCLLLQGHGSEHGMSSLSSIFVFVLQTRSQGTMICGWDKTVRLPCVIFLLTRPRLSSMHHRRVRQYTTSTRTGPDLRATFSPLGPVRPMRTVSSTRATAGTWPTRKRRSSADGASTLQATATRSQVTLVTSTTSRRTAGASSVSGPGATRGARELTGAIGNYDVSQMHYEGPGNVPGAPGHGYGYDIRVEGKSSADPPAAEPVAAAA